MKNILRLFAFVALLLLPVSQALAATFQSGDSLAISTKLSDDLYAAGSQITISEAIEGDVHIIGNSLLVNGDISEDLVVAGGNITLNSRVLDDVKTAGGTVVMTAPIDDDLFAAGGTITLSSEATIGGDAFVAGGLVSVAGDVSGEARIDGEEITLDGVVDGPVDIRGKRLTINSQINGNAVLAAEQIILGPNAEFGGNVRYWNGGGEIDFTSHLTGGTAQFDMTLEQFSSSQHVVTFGTRLVGMAVSLLAAALILLLFVIFGTRYFTRIADDASSSYWKSFGIGILFFIAVIPAMTLLAITIIGIPLSLFVGAVFGFSIYLAPIVAALVTTLWLGKKAKQTWSKPLVFLIGLGLLIVLKALSLIPFVGVIVMLAIVPASYGSILRNLKRKSPAAA